MRVLVIGATGYVGSRLIPTLLEAGHEVYAGARDLSRLDTFWWVGNVTPVAVDVLSAASTRAAITGDTDAIVYLVHGMADDGFADADRKAAGNVRDSVDAAGVARVVYVSGMIPDDSIENLSEHLQSRRDVEVTLSQSTATVVTLRTAMVIGGGSTSFELMRQLADRLPVTIVPDWMNHQVEPIAIIDLLQAIAGALTADIGTGHFDVGDGEPIPYPELMQRYAEIAGGTEKLQLTSSLLPEKLVSQVASWIADFPPATVKALMSSLQHDMIASDSRWRTALVSGDYATVPTTDAIGRAVTAPDPDCPDAERDPLQRFSSDPECAT